MMDFLLGKRIGRNNWNRDFFVVNSLWSRSFLCHRKVSESSTECPLFDAFRFFSKRRFSCSLLPLLTESQGRLLIMKLLSEHYRPTQKEEEPPQGLKQILPNDFAIDFENDYCFFLNRST
jgi:hypothetical protein